MTLRRFWKRAQKAGIKKFYLPCINSETIDDMLRLEKNYPSVFFAMMGLHPCSVKENFLQELKVVEEYLLKRKFAAVGEIGLDFYWDTTFKNEQLDAFNTQMELALQYKFPHCHSYKKCNE